MENGLTPESEALYQSVIVKYRQKLDHANWELIRATAQNEQKDQQIAELHEIITELRQLADSESPDVGDE